MKKYFFVSLIGLISSLLSVNLFTRGQLAEAVGMFSPGIIFGLALIFILRSMEKISLKRKISFVLLSTIAYTSAFFTSFFIGVSLMNIDTIGERLFTFIPGGIVGTSILSLGIKFVLRYKIEDVIIPIILIGGVSSIGFTFSDLIFSYYDFTFSDLILPNSSYYGIIIWQMIMINVLYYFTEKYPRIDN